MLVPNITGQIIELHRTGKIKILAVNAPARHPLLPDVPTAIEAGVPGLIAQNFFGVFAPSGTPKPIVERIDAATQAALADPAFRKRLGDSGFEPVTGFGPERSATYVKEEYARWLPIVRAAGILGN
jgi:tripartite-type tricarboxylate transporter receptor subunit TctC